MDDEKYSIPSGKFMYIPNDDGGIDLYGLNEDLTPLTEKPLFRLSAEKIQKAKEYEGNMYYPALPKKGTPKFENTPPELKLIYVVLKNAFDRGYIKSPWIVGIYDKDKKFQGVVGLLLGR